MCIGAFTHECATHSLVNALMNTPVYSSVSNMHRRMYGAFIGASAVHSSMNVHAFIDEWAPAANPCLKA
jgi:hypothetical protein